MSPILQVISMQGLNNRNSASVLQGVTDMVIVHAMGHNLWVRDVIIVLLSTEEGFELNKPHQDVL